MATSEDPSRPELQEKVEGKVPRQDEEKLKNLYIGSVDQGTTSTRFLIFNGLGTPVASHQIEFKQLYPHPGWVVTEKSVVMTDDEH